MLKTAIITATILGCDCDARQCEYIRDEPVQWTSIEECETDIQLRTIGGAGSAYPTVIAVCYAPAAAGGQEPASPGADTTAENERTVAAPVSGRFFAATVKSYVTLRRSLGSAADATLGAARWTVDRLATISSF